MRDHKICLYGEIWLIVLNYPYYPFLYGAVIGGVVPCDITTVYTYYSELHVRGGIKDNLKIIFLISQLIHLLLLLIRTVTM